MFNGKDANLSSTPRVSGKNEVDSGERLGTKVKIFATHHDDFITLDSDIIENVRAASQYAPEGSGMRGNDEGINISDKSESFCELTTQYWVWKNIKDLDYYGFCHYRRFISFGGKLKSDEYANVFFGSFDDSLKELMGYDRHDLVNEIEKYDIILTEPWDVSKTGIGSVFAQYDAAPELFIEDLECALEILEEKYPEYLPAAKEYLSGRLFYPCNMFIMRRDIFDEYCVWLFDILFELEKRRDTSNYSLVQYRMIGHVGERLLGVFVEYQKKKNKYKVGIKQRITVEDMIPYREPLPFRKENNIPILFATNDNFALYTVTAIHSVVAHSSKINNYDILVLYSNLSKKNIAEILKTVDKLDNFKIRFINVSKFLKGYYLKPNFHISVETFYRLLAPDLLRAYSKVVYLDGDIIVLEDIANLYLEDMGNNLLAGVIDSDFLGQYNGFKAETKKYADEVLKLKNPYAYCQAGVLLMNLDEMRRTFEPYELVEIANEMHYLYGDQDVLNKACEGRIHYVDMAWNVMHACGGLRLEIIGKFAPREISKAYFESRKNPKIIHYAGHSKPWNDPYDDFAEAYWSAIRDSAVYEKLLSRITRVETTVTQSVLHEILSKVKEIRVVKRLYRKLKAVADKIG